MLATGTGFAAVYLQIAITLPLTLAARGLPVGHAGILLTVSALTLVVAQPLVQAGPVRRLDDFAAMALGYLLLGAGLLATGFAQSLPELVPATVVWSLGDLLLLGRAYTVVAALAPDGARGGYLATYGLSWGVAAVVAPLFGTGLLAAGGPPLAWSVLAGMCLLLAVVQPFVRRQVSGGTPPASTDRPAPRPARR